MYLQDELEGLCSPVLQQVALVHPEAGLRHRSIQRFAADIHQLSSTHSTVCEHPLLPRGRTRQQRQLY